MATTNQSELDADSAEASSPAAGSDEAAQSRRTVRRGLEDGTAVTVGVGAVWSLVLALLAVHAGHQHKLVELWGFIYAAFIGLAIPLVGLKWPGIYEHREPGTYAEAAALMRLT